MRRYVCTECTATRKTQDSMRAHILLTHASEMLAKEPEYIERYLHGNEPDPQRLDCFARLVSKLTMIYE